MGQALYRQQRPKALSEVVGQDHITTALEKALEQGRISHAYLLTGPRGVGKTSVARILAHAVNGLPYSDESTHLDIIEIDAASHRRIDEIRDLRERVHIAPTSAKYKVYIIDEVHMLTREAFNALLKTLEEPPAHVIFILATTEAHKLPETIISRTQRFNFRPIDETKIAEHLATIAKAEKIAIDQGALQLIARHGDGSFRDSISLLDQVRTTNSQITATDVLTLLGQVPATLIDSVLKALAESNIVATVQALQSLNEQGFEPTRIAKQLAESLRSGLVDEASPIPRSQALSILSGLIEVPASTDPAIALEVTLLNNIPEVEPLAKPGVSGPTKKVAAAIASAPEKSKTASPQDAEMPIPEKPVKPITMGPKPLHRSDESLWPKVLESIKSQHNTLYGIARMAVAEYVDGTLTLAFHFAFHQKRLNDQANRRIIADTVHELTGEDVIVTCVLDKNLPGPELIVDEAKDISDLDDPALQDISNIFGGAELLQSE